MSCTCGSDPMCILGPSLEEAGRIIIQFKDIYPSSWVISWAERNCKSPYFFLRSSFSSLNENIDRLGHSRPKSCFALDVLHVQFSPKQSPSFADYTEQKLFHDRGNIYNTNLAYRRVYTALSMARTFPSSCQLYIVQAEKCFAENQLIEYNFKDNVQ